MLASPAFLESFRNSFLISGVSAALTTALAFFLAYAVNNTGLPPLFRKFIAGMTVAPMFLPTITYGIYTLPVAFLLINNTFKYVDKNFAIVSKVMGDGPVRTFLGTAVRPLVGTLGAALIQSFTLSFTDFGIPASIGGSFDVVAIHLYNEMLGAIPNFGGGAAVAVSMLLPSIISILLINYLERYNFRYHKVSRQDIVKSPLRDAVCGAGSLAVIGTIAAVFAVMFVVPFVRNWPYEVEFSLERFMRILSSRGHHSGHGARPGIPVRLHGHQPAKHLPDSGALQRGPFLHHALPDGQELPGENEQGLGGHSRPDG